MHIPDGYLSPATCAALYAGAAPFWYVAVQRVKKALQTRLVPLLSLFAAFSFVVMMFNLPLPGGTTGHAVGVGLASVVLGPWAAMLAVSVALVIQALFFGDGGITAIGANCFNMAIVGALVSYAVYRLLAARAPLHRSAAGAGGRHRRATSPSTFPLFSPPSSSASSRCFTAPLPARLFIAPIPSTWRFPP